MTINEGRLYMLIAQMRFWHLMSKWEDIIKAMVEKYVQS